MNWSDLVNRIRQMICLDIPLEEIHKKFLVIGFQEEQFYFLYQAAYYMENSNNG